MEIILKRPVFGIKFIPIGPCHCDQDCCLICEIKFRTAMFFRKG